MGPALVDQAIIVASVAIVAPLLFFVSKKILTAASVVVAAYITIAAVYLFLSAATGSFSKFGLDQTFVEQVQETLSNATTRALLLATRIRQEL
jgi:hypothetical protein